MMESTLKKQLNNFKNKSMYEKIIFVLSLVLPFGIFIMALMYFFYAPFKNFVENLFSNKSKTNFIPDFINNQNNDMENKTDTLGFKNKNLLNIRYSTSNNWTGQTGQNKGFCVFDSFDNGLRAAIKLLRKYNTTYGRKTVEQIISKWAPSNENDTTNYINFVAKKMQIDATEKIDLDDKELLYKLIYAMCLMESNYKVSQMLFLSAYSKI